MYCNVYQRLAKRFIIYSVNDNNKQNPSGKGKSQDKFKTFYIHVLKTLGTFETTLTTKSNYLIEKLALPVPPASFLVINIRLIQCSEF